MRNVKSRSVLAIVLVIVIGMISGCGLFQKFDAGGYTKACLDTVYKGEFEEYMKLTQRTKEQAQEDYDKNLEANVSQFKSLGISDELAEKYRTFFAELLKKTKYTIQDVKEDASKNFSVDIEIEPIQIFEGVVDETMTQVQTWAQEIGASGGSIPSDTEINEKYFQVLYDLLSAKLEGITYGEKQTITVKVTKSSDNVYSIADADYQKIDTMMYDIDKVKE